MSGKEWLEKIKRKFDLDRVGRIEDSKLISPQDLLYLIQQAERVQELESELNKQIEIGYKFEGEVYDLAKENKRYREALEHIERIQSVDVAQQIARQALEGEG